MAPFSIEKTAFGPIESSGYSSLLFYHRNDIKIFLQVPIKGFFSPGMPMAPQVSEVTHFIGFSPFFDFYSI